MTGSMLAVHGLAATGTSSAGPGALPGIIGLVVIVLLVVSRTRGTPLRAAKLLILPVAVMAAGGLAAVATAASIKPHLHAIDFVIIALDLVLSLGLGVARGVSVQLYRRDGAPWYRYGGVTVALWALSILLRLALAVFGAHHGASPLTASSLILFWLGVSLLTQNAVLLARAARQRLLILRVRMVRPWPAAWDVARGNPVRIRDCPAAVSGNERRH
jgi:hypothetical protein